MAKSKKNKPKVRTWRDPMVDIIEPKKEYMVMCSAGQLPMESDLDFPTFKAWIDEMVGRGLLVLEMEGSSFTCKISKEQHFAYTIFTRRAFDKMRANQQFSGMGVPQGARQ